MDELEERLARAGRTVADGAGVRAEVAALARAHARRGHRRWLIVPGAAVGIGLLLAGATGATASGSWSKLPGPGDGWAGGDGGGCIVSIEDDRGSTCVVSVAAVPAGSGDGTVQLSRYVGVDQASWRPVTSPEDVGDYSDHCASKMVVAIATAPIPPGADTSGTVLLGEPMAACVVLEAR